METTPADEQTGLPLLLVPNDDVLPLLDNRSLNQAQRQQGESFADWNHVFHPRRDPRLTSDDGQAVRNSRVQLVMRSDHSAYHEAYAGPELPQTRHERFYTAVLCAAGYVPAEALDVRGKSARIVSLDESQRERLQTSGEVRMMGAQTVQKFMQSYVLGQSMDHLKESVIEEFLGLHAIHSSEASQRRRYLTHALLSQVVDRAAQPVDATYSAGLHSGFLRPDLPRHPRDFVHDQIVGQGSRNIRRIADLMQRRFRETVGLEPAIA